jgi:hypothetical protein
MIPQVILLMSDPDGEVYPAAAATFGQLAQYGPYSSLR